LSLADRRYGPARPFAHWAMLLAITVMWGSSPALTKLAVAELAPIDIVAVRLSLGAVLLWAVVVVQRRRLRIEARHLLFFAACGLFGNALPFYAITWGQTEVPSGLAAVCFAIMPLATIVLAHFFVEGERLRIGKLAGFLLGFAGIIVLVGPELLAEFGGAASLLVHQLAILGGALCYAVNAIISRRRPPLDVVLFAACTLTASALMTLPPALLSGIAAPAAWISRAGLAVLALAVIGTAVPTVIMFRLVSAAGPSFLALINYLIPVYGLLVGMAVLDESVAPHAIAALVVILAGVMLSERARRPVAR